MCTSAPPVTLPAVIAIRSPECALPPSRHIEHDHSRAPSQRPGCLRIRNEIRIWLILYSSSRWPRAYRAWHLRCMHQSSLCTQWRNLRPPLCSIVFYSPLMSIESLGCLAKMHYHPADGDTAALVLTRPRTVASHEKPFVRAFSMSCPVKHSQHSVGNKWTLRHSVLARPG